MLNEEEYGERLKGYSDDTIRLIMQFTDEESIRKQIKITTDPELNEEEVAKRLRELLKSM